MIEGRPASATRRTQRPEDPMPLAIARACFMTLTDDPRPLRVDERPFAGLPNRPLAHLVRRMRQEGEAWTPACLDDVQAEVRAGFLEVLTTIAPVRPRWTAYRTGTPRSARPCRHRCRSRPGPARHRRTAPGATRTRPWHGRSRTKVLSRTEADLIGATQLDGQAVADWADCHRTTAQASYKARHRAEDRLVTVSQGRTRTAAGAWRVRTLTHTNLPLPGFLRQISRPGVQKRRVTRSFLIGGLLTTREGIGTVSPGVASA